MTQTYVHGITDTVTHDVTSGLTQASSKPLARR